MRRIRDRGEAETDANVRQAFENYSDQKHKRRTVKEYEENLDTNVQIVLQQLIDESWQPAPYTKKVVFERKRRVLAKTIVHDHVIEAAAILPYEKALYDYIAWQSMTFLLLTCRVQQLYSSSKAKMDRHSLNSHRYEQSSLPRATYL